MSCGAFLGMPLPTAFLPNAIVPRFWEIKVLIPKKEKFLPLWIPLGVKGLVFVLPWFCCRNRHYGSQMTLKSLWGMRSLSVISIHLCLLQKVPGEIILGKWLSNGGYLVMTGDIFGFWNCWRSGLASGVEARDATEHLTIHTATLPLKESPGPKCCLSQSRGTVLGGVVSECLAGWILQTETLRKVILQGAYFFSMCHTGSPDPIKPQPIWTT